MNKKIPFLLFLCLLIGAGISFAQSPSARLQSGIDLYAAGQWREAVIELRRAQAEAPDTRERSEALYWISLAELSAGAYEAAVKDMDELLRIDPAGERSGEIPYHKGRSLYYLGHYDEAIVLLKAYSDKTGDATKKAAALYWIGECLYSMGQLEMARDVFSLVAGEYPQSAKYEAASYRIALINQKKIEGELLKILKWSHEESLRTVEEYQRRERSYDQAIIAYQKRIADMLKDTRLADLEKSNADYRRQLSEAEARIAALEASLLEVNASAEALRSSSRNTNGLTLPDSSSAENASQDSLVRLLSLKAMALEVQNELSRRYNEGETE